MLKESVDDETRTRPATHFGRATTATAPVLEFESGDALEFTFIVGDESEPRGFGVISNPERALKVLTRDAEHKRVYVPGGEGVIYVFQMNDPDHYRLFAKSPTALGGRTAGYFGRQSKSMHRFFLAVPASGGQSPELRIFTVQE